LRDLAFILVQRTPATVSLSRRIVGHMGQDNIHGKISVAVDCLVLSFGHLFSVLA